MDLTLTWQGQPLALGVSYDEFTNDAHVLAFEEPGRDETVRLLRRLHVRALCGAAGFVPHPEEIWHAEWGTCRWGGFNRKPALFAANA